MMIDVRNKGCPFLAHTDWIPLAFVPPGGVPLTRRHTTQQSRRSFRSTVHDQSTMNRGYGGFPYPTAIILRGIKKFFPGVQQRLVRTVTIPATRSISTIPGSNANGSTMHVPYISFNAIVGRNSKFHLLTEEHLEELGGVEYRALTALLWIVALVRQCYFSRLRQSDLIFFFSISFSCKSQVSSSLHHIWHFQNGGAILNRQIYTAMSHLLGSLPFRSYLLSPILVCHWWISL